jgi:hypothetical protein
MHTAVLVSIPSAWACAIAVLLQAPARKGSSPAAARTHAWHRPCSYVQPTDHGSLRRKGDHHDSRYLRLCTLIRKKSIAKTLSRGRQRRQMYSSEPSLEATARDFGVRVYRAVLNLTTVAPSAPLRFKNFGLGCSCVLCRDARLGNLGDPAPGDRRFGGKGRQRSPKRMNRGPVTPDCGRKGGLP